MSWPASQFYPRFAAAERMFSLRSRWMCVGALLLTIGIAPVPAWAQAKAEKTEIAAPEPMTLLTKDGVNIHITYYKSNAGAETPVIVLLHMNEGNRFVWQNGFAERLQAEGYAVITADLRGHGESKPDAGALPAGNANQGTDKKKKGEKKTAPANSLKARDYEAMVTSDMEAIKKFIYDENQEKHLNMGKIGIVGPELGAAIAVNFAMLDWAKEPHPDGVGPARTRRGQDVQALVLISPDDFPGVGLLKTVDKLRDPALNIAFFIAVGSKMSSDKQTASKLYKQLTSFKKNEERMFLEEFNAKLRGTDMLDKKLKLEEKMLAFFDVQLKARAIPWSDRQSKLDKPRK